jgi:hypothetical protein
VFPPRLSECCGQRLFKLCYATPTDLLSCFIGVSRSIRHNRKRIADRENRIASYLPRYLGSISFEGLAALVAMEGPVSSPAPTPTGLPPKPLGGPCETLNIITFLGHEP